MLLLLITSIIVLEFVFKRYDKFQEKRKVDLETYKVISKHECFGKYKDDPEKFNNWIGNVLRLKGLTNIIFAAKGDGAKAIIATNKEKQTIYIGCNLGDPAKWDQPISRLEAQKLVGSMVGDGVKQGMMITTSHYSQEAKDYIKSVATKGYYVTLIDGDALVEELYNLREKKFANLIPVH